MFLVARVNELRVGAVRIPNLIGGVSGEHVRDYLPGYPLKIEIQRIARA